MAALDVPFFRRAFLLAIINHHLSLPWLRILNKGALLLMKLAKNTQNRTFVNHTTTFSPSAGVTRPLPSRSDVGETAEAVGLDLDEILLARHAPARMRPSGSNGHRIAIGTRQRRSGLNSNGHGGG